MNTNNPHHPNPENTPAFHKVVNEMQRLYDNKLSEREALQTARNFIGFSQLYLEVARRGEVQ